MSSVLRSDELRRRHAVPDDLCQAAVKFARRCQGLTPGHVYVIIMDKRQDAWTWHVSRAETVANITDK